MGKKTGESKSNTTRNTRSNSSSNQFTRRCKCSEHDAVGEFSSEKRLFNLKSKEVTVADKKLLLEKGYITDKSSYICSGCLAYAKSTTTKKRKYDRVETEDSDAVQSSDGSIENVVMEVVMGVVDEVVEGVKDDMIENVVNSITNDELTVDQLERISNALGKKVNEFLYDATKCSSSSYKNWRQLLLQTVYRTFLASRHSLSIS